MRVVARDTIAGAGTWFGVSAPRLAVTRPVAELTAGASVFADQIEIRDGLAEPPAYRLRAGDGLEGALGGDAFFAPCPAASPRSAGGTSNAWCTTTRRAATT